MQRERQQQLNAIIDESNRILGVEPAIKFYFELYTMHLLVGGLGAILLLTGLIVRIDLHFHGNQN